MDNTGLIIAGCAIALVCLGVIGLGLIGLGHFFGIGELLPLIDELLPDKARRRGQRPERRRTTHNRMRERAQQLNFDDALQRHASSSSRSSQSTGDRDDEPAERGPLRRRRSRNRYDDNAEIFDDGDFEF